jgi:hypothetical protein
MELISWLPAITTTGALAVVLWLCRQLISTRLTRSVQHEFDNKLESIRAELRTSEERLRAQLREKEAEIAALRGGALSALASRQAAVDKRRLEAVDQLWSSFNALGPARFIAASMSRINFEYASRRAPVEPQLRRFFEMIGGDFDPKLVDCSGAKIARPFLSPMVWAVYSAIEAITMHGVLQWHVLKNGMGAKDFSDHEAIERLILAALPHYAEHLRTHGPSAYYTALEALDSLLLSEIHKMLSGSDSDRASIERAAAIVEQVKAVQAETEKAEGGEFAP